MRLCKVVLWDQCYSLSSSMTCQGCKLVQYADSSQFIFTGSPFDIRAIVAMTERTLKHAKHYFDANGLKVNPDKAQATFLGSRKYLAKMSIKKPD